MKQEMKSEEEYASAIQRERELPARLPNPLPMKSVGELDWIQGHASEDLGVCMMLGNISTSQDSWTKKTKMKRPHCKDLWARRQPSEDLWANKARRGIAEFSSRLCPGSLCHASYTFKLPKTCKPKIQAPILTHSTLLALSPQSSFASSQHIFLIANSYIFSLKFS